MTRRTIVSIAFTAYSACLFWLGMLLSGGGHDFSFLLLGGSPFMFGYVLYPFLGWISESLEKKRNRWILVTFLLLGYVDLLPVILGEPEYRFSLLRTEFVDYSLLRSIFIDDLAHSWRQTIFLISAATVLVYGLGHVYLWYRLVSCVKRHRI